MQRPTLFVKTHCVASGRDGELGPSAGQAPGLSLDLSFFSAAVPTARSSLACMPSLGSIVAAAVPAKRSALACPLRCASVPAVASCCDRVGRTSPSRLSLDVDHMLWFSIGREADVA